MAYRDTVLALNPTAYWRWEETGVTTHQDESPNNNDMPVYGGPGIGVTGGAVGNYINIDGNDDYGAPPIDLSGQSKVSVSSWIRPNSYISDHRRVFSQEYVFYVGMYRDQLSFYVGNGSSWSYSHSDVGPVFSDYTKWRHVVWVYDAGTARVYLDGTEVWSTSGWGATTGSNANALTLGAIIPSNLIQKWRGDLDETAIWVGTALTASDASALFVEGMDGKDADVRGQGLVVVGKEHEQADIRGQRLTAVGREHEQADVRGQGLVVVTRDEETLRWTASSAEAATGSADERRATNLMVESVGNATDEHRATNLMVEALELVPQVVSPSFIDAQSEVFGAAGYPDAVQADGPVAYWRLNETSGTVAADAMGAASGTHVGAVQLDQAGPAELVTGAAAVNYPDTTAHTRVPVQVGAVGSLEAWVDTSTWGSGRHGIFQSGDTASVNYAGWLWLGKYENGNFYFRMVNTSASLVDLATTWTTWFPSNAWVHMVATWGEGYMRLYVNGVEVANQTISGTYNGDAATDSRIGFGHQEGGNNQKIDEVAFYDKILTPDQVVAHYNARSLTTSGAPTVSESTGPSAQNLEPGFIASAETLYAPTVDVGAPPQQLDPTFIAASGEVYAPTVSLGPQDQQVAPGAISSSEEVYAPTVVAAAAEIAPQFIPSQEALYGPSVAREQDVQPPLVDDGSTVYGPTVELAGGPQDLNPTRIPASAEVYAPTLLREGRVTPSRLASGAQVFAPVVRREGMVRPQFIPSAEQVYAPSSRRGRRSLPMWNKAKQLYEEHDLLVRDDANGEWVPPVDIRQWDGEKWSSLGNR